MKLMRPTCLVALWAGCIVAFLSTQPAYAETPKEKKIETRTDEHASQLQRAKDLTSWMAFRSDKIQRRLREARRLSSQRAVLCLDTLLSQSHAIEKQAVQTEKKIRRAAITGHGATIGSHMRRMQMLLDRSLDVSAQARKCF